MNVILKIATAVLYFNFAAFFALSFLCALDGVTHQEAVIGFGVIITLAVICLVPFEIRNNRSQRS